MLTFVNGVNDASHSIASVVETRARAPLEAGVSSAIANFIALFIFTAAVTATFGTALVVPGAMTPLSLVIAMLVSNMLIPAVTHIGLPVSGSHAVIGGIPGSGVAVAGLSALFLPPASMIRALVLFSLTGAGIGSLIHSILACYLREGFRPVLVLGVILGISVTIPLMIPASHPLSRRDHAWHEFRWMERYQQAGRRDHQNPAISGFLRCIIGGVCPCDSDNLRDPGIIHPGDERIDRRCRCYTRCQGGKMGGHLLDDGGMGSDHSPRICPLLVCFHGPLVVPIG